MPTPRKRQTDENVFVHVDASQPKRARRVLPNVNTPEFKAAHQRAVEDRLRQQQEQSNSEATRAMEDEKRKAQADADAVRLKDALSRIKDSGFTTLDKFITHLLATQDPHLSSEVTKLVDRHGARYLEAIQNRSPVTVHTWATGLVLEAVANEGKHLAAALRPSSSRLTPLLETWSLENVLAKAKDIAPTIYQLLQAAGTHVEQGSQRRDRDLVCLIRICACDLTNVMV